MEDRVKIVNMDGARKLIAWRDSNYELSIRILSELQLEHLSAGSFKMYRKKFQKVLSIVDVVPNLTEATTIKTLDFLKAAIAREHERRNQ